MSHPSILRHPSLESSSPRPSVDSPRPSLFDSKDDFIARIGPIGVAAIYFGPFSLAPQDPALSRQALLKLSFAYRYYLQPAGIRFHVQRQTATISGSIKSTPLALCAEILAQQIEGIEQVKNETELAVEDRPAQSRELLAIQLLLATDQSLRSQIKVSDESGAHPHQRLGRFRGAEKLGRATGRRRRRGGEIGSAGFSHRVGREVGRRGRRIAPGTRALPAAVDPRDGAPAAQGEGQPRRADAPRQGAHRGASPAGGKCRPRHRWPARTAQLARPSRLKGRGGQDPFPATRRQLSRLPQPNGPCAPGGRAGRERRNGAAPRPTGRSGRRARRPADRGEPPRPGA